MKMKGPAVFGLLIIACSFTVNSAPNSFLSQSSADKWLEMRMRDVNAQCKLNANFTIDLSTFSLYQKQLLEFMEPIKDLGIKRSEYTFYHTYNPSLVGKIKDMIIKIQKCLNPENRLDPQGMILVLRRILDLHATRVQLLNADVGEDMKECELIIQNREIFACFESFPHYPKTPSSSDATVFEMLTVTVTGSSSCEEIQPFEECYMKAMRRCSANAKKIVKVMLSPPETGICENFLRESEEDPTIHLDDDDDMFPYGTDSLRRLFHVPN